MNREFRKKSSTCDRAPVPAYVILYLLIEDRTLSSFSALDAILLCFISERGLLRNSLGSVSGHGLVRTIPQAGV